MIFNFIYYYQMLTVATVSQQKKVSVSQQTALVAT